MRVLSLFFLVAVAGGVEANVAFAESKGIVVRVATDGSPISGESVVFLTPEGGNKEEIVLNDAGEPPDVDAGDGTLSGSSWLEGDAFSVSVRLSGKLYQAGRVSWDESDSKRDLNVTVVGGLITAEASVSQPLPPQPDGTVSSEPEPRPQPAPGDELPAPDTSNPGGEPIGDLGNGSRPPSPGGDGGSESDQLEPLAPESDGTVSEGLGPGPQSDAGYELPTPDTSNPGGAPIAEYGDGPRPPSPGGEGGSGSVRPPEALGTGPQPDSGPEGLMLAQLFGLALGIVAIVAVVKWWWAPVREEPGDSLGRTLLGEPGLLGSGTPSLSEGLSVWAVSAADAPALVEPLLTTVARHRRVCLLAPGTLTSPRVFGGPVYRVADRSSLGESLQELGEPFGLRVAGFVVAEQPNAETLSRLQAVVPEGAALVVLAVEPAQDVTGGVLCRRDGERWVIGAGDAAVVAAVVAGGLVPVTA